MSKSTYLSENLNEEQILLLKYLIDAGGGQQGEFVNKWKLRLNVSQSELLSMAQNDY